MARKGLEMKTWTLFAALSVTLMAGCGDKKEADKADDSLKAASTDDALPAGLTAEQAAKVVAKVGERSITVGDVTRQINRLSPYIRRRWAAPEKRKEFLDKLVRVELLSQEAERLGLGDDPEIQRTLKQVMIRLFVKDVLEKDVLPSSVPEAELKAEYEKEIDKYKRPEQVRASHIVVATKTEATKLIAELKQNTTDARVFREKAREASLDAESKDRGGDLGYFSKPAQRREDEPLIDPKVAEAAWTLANIGDLYAEPVQTSKGFHVIKLTNKRPEMNRTFDSVKRIIESRLLRDKRKEAMDKYVADLRGKSKVEVFAENLDKLKVEVSPEEMEMPPGMMPGGMPPGMIAPPPSRDKTGAPAAAGALPKKAEQAVKGNSARGKAVKAAEDE
jgi:peptidyl-prolyl cis-trans isomerase C